MDARDLVRSVRVAASAQGVRAARSAWRRRRTDAVGLPRQRGERARAPGEAVEASGGPGGGEVRFARSVLRVRVTVTGAVFLGWDGAGPEPSYALAAGCPPADPRAELEPDKDGGWRVVSERMLVAVSRHGAVEVRTPGGVLLRRDRPPRWWEGEAGRPGPDAVADGAGARWLQRSELPPDARFFGLGGRDGGPRLRDGAHRLWNAPPGDGTAPSVTMPVLLSVADAGTLLVFHDNPWDGTVALREGVEGLGSGHDRPGRCEVRMSGGPLRYWVVAGAPSRVLHGWAALTGAPALPPRWALGHQHAEEGSARDRSARARGGPDVPGLLDRYRRHGLPLRALHTARTEGTPGPPRRAAGSPGAGAALAEPTDVFEGAGSAEGSGRSERPGVSGEFEGVEGFEGARGVEGFDEVDGVDEVDGGYGWGVRFVAVVGPGVPAGGRGAAGAVYGSGSAADAFVRDARGLEVRGAARSGEVVWPDFTDPRVRKWWGGLYAEQLYGGGSGDGQGAGWEAVAHDGNEPAAHSVLGGPALPSSARHALEGRGGDHREAHNVYALTMAKAGDAAQRELLPERRPFLFSRSGWAGIQRYGGVWSEHPGQGWGALRATLSAVTGLGLCGVPYAGPDITVPGAGAVAGGAGRADDGAAGELYLRWFQMAAYMPLFRTRTGADGHGEPWRFGARVLAHARAALAERERLLPYLLTLAQLAERTGAPYVRPVWWQHPRDRALRDCQDAFLLGDALLVAPVLEPGVRERTVRLPSGRWYDTATGAAYDGPRTVRVPAPLDRIPVLARAGAAVPVRGAGGGTELEVWPPAPGRTGNGLVIRDPGPGWERPAAERFTVHRTAEGGAVVERDGGGAVGYPVRVRGG
ncbi:glycoside hydrolase family 31 protein [Streptomyces cacaoi]|uniref:glycoside hydrolase family 31 protein n=1 Tax=Streptomyces cacaoi TaxID=1898 RepID=UPI0026352D2A|nr:glycoside hydrolase family 31 protein [Streptomyces cacaoi]